MDELSQITESWPYENLRLDFLRISSSLLSPLLFHKADRSVSVSDSNSGLEIDALLV